MYDEEDYPEHINNPLLMSGVQFKLWLFGRGVDSVGIPPGCPIKRANILFELAEMGRISHSEIGNFLREIWLMIPIAEN